MPCCPTCCVSDEPGLECLSVLNPSVFGQFGEWCRGTGETQRRHVLNRTRMAFSSKAELQRVLAPISGGAGADCNCKCGRITVGVTGCSVGVPSGLMITITQGGSTLYSASAPFTTAAMFSAGTYTVTITSTFFETFTTTVLLNGRCDLAIVSATLVPIAGYACQCSSCGDPVPSTLHLTDVNGTWTLTWGGFFWSVCYTMNSALETCAPGAPFPNVCSGAAGSGDFAVSYKITCPTVSTNNYVLQMAVSACGNNATPETWNYTAGSCVSNEATTQDSNCGSVGSAGSEPGGPYNDSTGGWATGNCNTGSAMSLSFDMNDFLGANAGMVMVTA